MTSSPLVNLSDELRLVIVEIVESEKQCRRDLLNLSSTCRSYRTFLSPNIFTKVTLRNDEESGLAIQVFLCSERSIFVKELHYQGVTVVPADHVSGDIVEVEEQEEQATVLSEPTREVLCDLKRFPNLERLTVEFPWRKGDIDVGFYHFEEVESDVQVLEREEEDTWRALMAKTYAAIGENKDSSTVKSLDLRGLMARVVSSWWTVDFQTFLGSLQDFRLSTVAMDNGAGWCQNTHNGYLDFLFQLGDNLTSHLHAAETLFIAGNNKGPIGCSGMRHALSSLKVKDMPKLRHLHLQYFFLDPPLIEFIESHIETLETIVLDECFGTWDHSYQTLASDGYGWKEFFDGIQAKKPRRLAQFDITWKNIEFPWDKEYRKIDENSDQVRTGKSLLESGRLAFMYAHLDDKYGMLFQDDDANLEQLIGGEDFEAYCRLMVIVKENSAITQSRLES
ncbi:hypothetical protein CPB83DRAFT_886093 [Crepidotus variabilis]|uniref:F-box domain-containing protein n=1 Tax=Crepidotus variabilis TaxID=179855 RepID=A0A9P6E9B0_9AGAR|nr:hypothetical protein CPB83DRAFT_886093 [Crepidotus variabilis]